MSEHTTTPSAWITEEVSSWPGVEAGPGSRGELSFKVRRREIGHLHGDQVAHFGLPKSLWSELIEAGRIQRHPIDRPGWAAVGLGDDDAVTEAIGLMRVNYERAMGRVGDPV